MKKVKKTKPVKEVKEDGLKNNDILKENRIGKRKRNGILVAAVAVLLVVVVIVFTIGQNDKIDEKNTANEISNEDNEMDMYKSVYEYEGEITISFYFLKNCNRLKVLYNENDVIEYDASRFTIPTDYYDNMLDLDISAYNDDNEIGKLSMNNIYILNNKNVLKIPNNIKRIYAINEINNSEFAEICNNANLIELLINSESLTDISPLSELKCLKYFNLSDCVGISDISPLSELTNLKYLYIGGCDNITDYSPLDNLTNTEIVHY